MTSPTSPASTGITPDDATPPGFATVTPYFVADDADAFIAFLINGLGGEHLETTRRDDGKIANAQIRLGNAAVMVGQTRPGSTATQANYYLYVADADASMARAIAAGATEIMAVANMPYDDRQGGVRDAHGNIWWISQRLVAGGYNG